MSLAPKREEIDWKHVRVRTLTEVDGVKYRLDAEAMGVLIVVVSERGPVIEVQAKDGLQEAFLFAAVAQALGTRDPLILAAAQDMAKELPPIRDVTRIPPQDPPHQGEQKNG